MLRRARLRTMLVLSDCPLFDDVKKGESYCWERLSERHFHFWAYILCLYFVFMLDIFCVIFSIVDMYWIFDVFVLWTCAFIYIYLCYGHVFLYIL